MMLTLLVAVLAIGCSSAPEAPAAPAATAAPVSNLSEKEALAIARSSKLGNACFRTKAPEDEEDDRGSHISYEKYTDFTHSESASFKPSGIWVVTAKTSWNWERGTIKIVDATRRPVTIDEDEKYPVDSGSSSPECIIAVDDATGKVTSN